MPCCVGGLEKGLGLDFSVLVKCSSLKRSDVQ